MNHNQNMLVYEQQAWELAAQYVCGCDEAGRGCLAGPVVAAAVHIPKEHISLLKDVNDSKQLSESKRSVYFLDILKYADVGVGIVSAFEIDQINIYEASRKAMVVALDNLGVDQTIDYVLTDAMPIPNQVYPVQSIIKGDQKSLSIAAASIVAKCLRDNLMKAYGELYPQYGFEKHKGYGTKQHLLALEQHGILTDIHRMSYKPVAELLVTQETLF